MQYPGPVPVPVPVPVPAPAAAAAATAAASPLWWLPYALGGFMLTPFAIWAGLFLTGTAGPKSGFGTPEMAFLVLASLPLAGFFFLANLGQMASAMRSGPAGERMPRAARLMPWLSAGIGLAGIGVLAFAGREIGGMIALGGATVAMVALMALSLRGKPATGSLALPPPSPAAEQERVIWLIATPLLAIVFLALAWTPAVIFYAALAAVPLAFVAILSTAHAGVPEDGE